MLAQTFDAWMYKVDARLEDRLGLVSADLPDQEYAEYYAAGMTPAECAEDVISNCMDEIEVD